MSKGRRPDAAPLHPHSMSARSTAGSTERGDLPCGRAQGHAVGLVPSSIPPPPPFRRERRLPGPYGIAPGDSPQRLSCARGKGRCVGHTHLTDVRAPCAQGEGHRIRSRRRHLRGNDWRRLAPGCKVPARRSAFPGRPASDAPRVTGRLLPRGCFMGALLTPDPQHPRRVCLPAPEACWPLTGGGLGGGA